MALIGVDLTAFPEEVRKRMAEIWTRENEMEMIKAKVRQEQIAKFYHDHPPRWKDGFGEMTMAIDPYWRSYFAMLHRTGEVWEEKDFRRWLTKNMPELGVKAVSGKTQVGYRGGLVTTAGGLRGSGRVVKKYSSPEGVLPGRGTGERAGTALPLERQELAGGATGKEQKL